MKHPELGGGSLTFQQSVKQDAAKPRSREVSSRFLSLPPSGNGANSSPTTNTPSLVRQTPGAGRSPGNQKTHETTADSGLLKGLLWPASSSSSTKTKMTTRHEDSSEDKFGGSTLAECFRNERKMELSRHKSLNKPQKKSVNANPMSLNRQQSCKEINEYENGRSISKENHKPLFGGSMRYTGKFKFPGRSSKSSSSTSSSSSNLSDDNIVPGRYSVDETALRRRSLGRTKSDYLADYAADSVSEHSDFPSSTSFSSPLIGKSLPASYMAPTVSSRMAGIEVSSKYLQDSQLRSRGRSSNDSASVHKPSSAESSPRIFSLKNAMKKSNSAKMGGLETAKVGDSPRRCSSPGVSEENKGIGMSKPPTSPSRVKGVGNLLSIGLDLLKGKKSSHPSVSSPLGLGIGESVHQLRMLHNRLVQWMYASGRAEAVNVNITKQAERNLVCAWDGLTKLRYSVRQKKMQLEKEKLDMKLDHILKSQIKSLEKWAAMEWQHQSAIKVTKDSLQSVICKVPLVEGAKVEPHSLSLVLRAASDITRTIQSMNSTYLPMAHETAATTKELAEIVIQEKMLLEECLEHFKLVSALEAEEASLKCNLMQLQLQSKQQHQQQLHQEICL